VLAPGRLGGLSVDQLSVWSPLRAVHKMKVSSVTCVANTDPSNRFVTVNSALRMRLLLTFVGSERYVMDGTVLRASYEVVQM
jgi:hypothetical protein